MRADRPGPVVSGRTRPGRALSNARAFAGTKAQDLSYLVAADEVKSQVIDRSRGLSRLSPGLSYDRFASCRPSSMHYVVTLVTRTPELHVHPPAEFERLIREQGFDCSVEMA